MPTPTAAGAQTNRGARPNAPDRPPDTIPAAPTANTGGNGGGLSTSEFPLGMGPGPGSSMWQEGVYVPTTQEGAPRRGDGSRPLSMGGGCAQVVAGVPTPAWGGCGMAWDQAAAALRLSLALGQSGACQEPPPPSPPPPPTARTDGGRGPSRQGAKANRLLAWMDPTTARSRPSDHCPGPPATCPGPLVACHEPFFAHGTGTARMRTRTRPGARSRAHGRHPQSPGTGDGTMASPCCDGGTPKPPWCSLPPTSAGDGLAPSVPWPPSWGYALGSCASTTS